MDCNFSVDSPRCTPSASGFLRAAEAVAEDLEAEAVLRRDGSAIWNLVREEEGESKRIILGPHLGSGGLGVAVFLAAFDKVQGGQRHQALALGAVARLRRDVARRRELARQPPTPAPSRLPPGGMCGLGSLIYGLATLGRLLGHTAMVADALTLCQAVDRRGLASEERLDVMFGVAGLLLALLALDRALADLGDGTPAIPATDRGLPLELAGLCARRLVSARRQREGDGAERVAGSPGFSHGAAGRTCALARFAHRTGDEESRAAARSEWKQADRDLSAGRRTSWCNGTAGLELARLELAGSHADAAHGDAAESGRRDGDEPLDRLAAPDEGWDHLCCGAAGRADVLAHAARHLHRPELLAAARRLGGPLRERLERRTVRRPHPEIVVEPRLLRGPTGIAYACLRLAAPEAVPCLLAFT